VGAKFLIESLEIRTNFDTATYRFSSGVTAVTGPLGSGKSSMLELIKYMLGGRAKVMPAIRDNVNLIVLRIRVGQEHWELTRQLGEHTLDVVDLTSGESLGTWAVTNRQNMRRLGPELMRALDLPADWRIPSSRKRPRGKTVPISFGDVYRYVYLDQNGIDTSVVGHNDPNLNNKRLAVFELLYGLSSPRTVELATERGKRLEEAEATRRAAAVVERFLQDTGDPHQADVAGLRRRAEQILESARLELAIARHSNGDGLVLRPAVAAVAKARGDFEELVSRRDEVAYAVAEAHAVMAQLDLDERSILRAEQVTESLSGLDFVQCPRCLQSLADRDPEPSRCLLCCQTQPSILSGDRKSAVKVLREQRKETRELSVEDETRLIALNESVKSTEASLVEGIQQLAKAQTVPSDPVLDAVYALSLVIANAKSEIVALDAAASRWANQRSLTSESGELEVEARRLAEEEARLKLELAENSTRVDDLSSVFNELLATLKDPWYQEAKIEKETYLPIVDGEPFDMLSVGGARKTLVNLSYHLANLSMSLSERDAVLLPTLLIVDSPRKNVGEGALDKSVVSAIYARLRTLQDASGDRFQIIFTDNELPASARAWVTSHIELDYESPFVPGVNHPGESVERVSESQGREMD
jgi:AAA domain